MIIMDGLTNPINGKESEMKSFVVISGEYSDEGVNGVFETLEQAVEYISSQSKKYFHAVIIELWEGSEQSSIWHCDPYDLKLQLIWQKK